MLSVSVRKRLNGFYLDVRWRIEKEVAVLFGHSGSGKSLTLQLIAGLVKPDEGTVLCGGRTVFDSSSNINIPPQGRRFGYVFQDLALFPHMTVAENIAYGVKKNGNQQLKDQVRQMVDVFHLEGLEARYPSGISGGQRQRVAFARALIGRPDALLLDEPFSALDAPLRNEMGRFLTVIRRQFDIPVILVTHDPAEACLLADSMIVYSAGKVVRKGRPAEIVKHPAHPEMPPLGSEIFITPQS